MGFADLSIADIAAEYHLSVETVFHLCDQLGVTYKNQQTNLALEDAKAIISRILSQRPDAAPKRRGNKS
jgi:DNA-binding MurR/RpiR family transcriptional regulator